MVAPARVPSLRAVWPGGHEVALARAAGNLADFFDSTGSMGDSSPFLLPLLDPRAPLPPIGVEALVLGLAAVGDAGGAAVDAAVAAIGDGRLTAPALADVLRRLLPEPCILPGRVGPRLAAVAAESALHAEVVRGAIDAALTEPLAKRRDLHALLEPLNELCAASGAAVTAPSARALLGSFSGRSKTARLAQDLLGRTGESAVAPAAAALAAEARIVRAERCP
jgi:hypothetical protein